MIPTWSTVKNSSHHEISTNGKYQEPKFILDFSYNNRIYINMLGFWRQVMSTSRRTLRGSPSYRMSFLQEASLWFSAVFTNSSGLIQLTSVRILFPHFPSGGGWKITDTFHTSVHGVWQQNCFSLTLIVLRLSRGHLMRTDICIKSQLKLHTSLWTCSCNDPGPLVSARLVPPFLLLCETKVVQMIFITSAPPLLLCQRCCLLVLCRNRHLRLPLLKAVLPLHPHCLLHLTVKKMKVFSLKKTEFGNYEPWWVLK